MGITLMASDKNKVLCSGVLCIIKSMLVRIMSTCGCIIFLSGRLHSISRISFLGNYMFIFIVVLFLCLKQRIHEVFGDPVKTMLHIYLELEALQYTLKLR